MKIYAKKFVHTDKDLQYTRGIFILLNNNRVHKKFNKMSTIKFHENYKAASIRQPK